MAARRWLRELLLNAQAAARGTKKNPKGNDLCRRLVRLADGVAAATAHELSSALEPLELLKAAEGASRKLGGGRDAFPLEPLLVTVPKLVAASDAGEAGEDGEDEARGHSAPTTPPRR